MILAPAAAKVVAARVTEAPPFEPAHQALGNDLVKTLPVLLGNEDPGEHCGIRHKLRSASHQSSILVKITTKIPNS